MKPARPEYGHLELMAVVFARDLQDGEVGVAAYFPALFAACLLAQKMHAPRLTIVPPEMYRLAIGHASPGLGPTSRADLRKSCTTFPEG